MSYIEQMMGRNESEEEAHDAVVLRAIEDAVKIADICGFLLEDPHPKNIRTGVIPVKVEVEYELGPMEHADVAVFWRDKLRFLMEIKSKREPQTASGWTRQIRRYEKAAGVPCILVIAHDLGETQKKYLRTAGIHAVDLRQAQR